MSFISSSRGSVELVVPYGNPNAQTHMRLAGEYITFCGRACEGWSVVDTPLSTAVDSAFTCKRCLKAMVK